MSLPTRVRRVQAARERVRDGGRGTPCLGPVTHAGCGALCPSVDRGCLRLLRPQDTEHGALTRPIGERGASERVTALVFRTFNAGAEPFRREPTPTAHDPSWLPEPQSRVSSLALWRARVRCTCEVPTGGSRRCSCRSTNRPGSSRRSSEAGPSPSRPDITARICGICPVAYQMSACAGD